MKWSSRGSYHHFQPLTISCAAIVRPYHYETKLTLTSWCDEAAGCWLVHPQLVRLWCVRPHRACLILAPVGAQFLAFLFKKAQDPIEWSKESGVSWLQGKECDRLGNMWGRTRAEAELSSMWSYLYCQSTIKKKAVSIWLWWYLWESKITQTIIASRKVIFSTILGYPNNYWQSRFSTSNQTCWSTSENQDCLT